MRKIRENILVASGDHNVFPADQDVFNEDGSTNVKEGQLVIWSPTTNRSVGAGTTPTDEDRIIVSVGVDTYNLRSNFGDVMYGNSIQAAKASGPSFGTPDVTDIFFNVTDTGDEFSISINVLDDQTENQFPFNRPETLTFTATRDEVGCVDCGDSGIDSMKLACLLRDRINRKVGNAPAYRRPTYQVADLGNENMFTAHVLYGASNTAVDTGFQYCVDPVATNDCDNCIEGDQVFHSMTYTDADGNPAEIEFTAVNNSAGDAVLLDRLEAVVTQINNTIGDKGTKNGSAVLIKGVGPCASHVIEVNTCDTEFAIKSGPDTLTETITPCETFNPYDSPLTEVNDCPQCGAGTTITSFEGGLRIVGKPVEIPTKREWDPMKAPKGILFRELEVFPTEGFRCSKTFVRKTQASRPPENIGYLWAWKEYASAAGGRGRNHDQWNSNVSAINVPLERSRVMSNITDPKESYCSYSIQHSLERRTTSVHGNRYSVKGVTHILIPSSDTVTIGDFEAIINPYITASGGPSIKTITCNTSYPDGNGGTTTQQDQIENSDTTDRYPDSNGWIV